MTRSKRSQALLGTLLALTLLAIGAGEARGSGFQIREASTSALGNAFAGATSGVEDITFMYFNPASMIFHDRDQIAGSSSFIAPHAELQSSSGSTIAGVPITPTPAFDGDNTVSENAIVPALYGMLSIDRDLKIGLAVTAPFGLETNQPGGWIGRYHASDSRLTTINVNPNVAFRVTDWASVGLGVQAMYGDARLTNAVDIGTIGAASGIPGSVPTMQDGFAKITGDDWGFGYNLGVMLEPHDRVRVGLAYRSKVNMTLDGDAKFDLRGSGTTGAALQSAGLFLDTDASAKIEMPAQASIGLNVGITDDVSLMGEVAWTQWSSFKDLIIDFANPAQPSNLTEEDWDDSWFFALGATWQAAEDWTLRFGVAHDQTPVPDRTRTPRIPDEDRYWIALGFNYAPTDWMSLDFGYTHIFLDDSNINLFASDPGSTFRGNLEASYTTSIDIVGLQGIVRF